MRDHTDHLALGKKGEDAAAAAMQSAGYRILDRNWRADRIEIDLICAKDDLIVFVEIKTRSSRKSGGASEAVTIKKQRRLAKGAQTWLSQHGLWLNPCRFDVICLYGLGEPFCMEHYPDAFSQTLDSSDSHRQF